MGGAFKMSDYLPCTGDFTDKINDEYHFNKLQFPC